MKNITGRVVKKFFGEGSKSEHKAVMLVTDEGEYKLRRRDGNPFYDPELEKLVGKAIRSDGIEHDYTFIMSKYEVLGAANSDVNDVDLVAGKDKSDDDFKSDIKAESKARATGRAKPKAKSKPSRRTDGRDQ